MDENLVGSTIKNRYRIDKFIGRGGMAEVYRVWDNKMAVFLAMKVLRDDLAEDKIFLRRFRREAHTLAELQHPHIVHFYRLEEDDGLVFMLMDLVEGQTLRKVISQSEEPFSFEKVLEIMRPVCSALHYAHQKNMVHCDVKPANIMIEKSGRILLADFGIARQTEGATTTTMVGAGTPAYMAPEQARGEDPTPRTDIYALGIVLYEMLTGGERPFTGEMATVTGTTGEKVRWEQVNLKPMSPRRFNPQISDELEAVVLKCLEKEPECRFSGVLELLEALQESLGFQVNSDANIHLGENKPSEPKENGQENQEAEPGQIFPQKADKQLPQKRHSQLRWVGLGIVGILILVLVFLLGKGDRNGSESEGLGARASLTLYPIAAEKQTFIPESTATVEITYTPTPTVLPSIIPTVMVERTCQIAFVSQRDGNYEIFVMNADGSNQLQLTFNKAEDLNPSWSPNGDKIIFTSDRDGNEEIYMMDSDGNNQHNLTSSVAKDKEIAWSPDGEKILFTSDRDGDREIYSFDADGRNLLRLTFITGSYGLNVNPAWSPDGKKIAFSSTRSGGSGVFVMNADGSSQRRLTSKKTYYDTKPVWSPDGEKIAFFNLIGDNREVDIINVNENRQYRLSSIDSTFDYKPVWSPDGEKIAFHSYSDSNSQIIAITADGSNRQILTSNNVTSGYPSWSPDGSYIAFISWLDGNHEIYIMNTDGSDQRRLTFGGSGKYPPVWSPLCK